MNDKRYTRQLLSLYFNNAERSFSGLDEAVADANCRPAAVIWDDVTGHPIKLVIGGKVYDVVNDDDSDGEGDEDDE